MTPCPARYGSLSVFESVSGIFVFKCVDGLWGREAENAALYLYTKALILASELIRPKPFPTAAVGALTPV